MHLVVTLFFAIRLVKILSSFLCCQQLKQVTNILFGTLILLTYQFCVCVSARACMHVCVVHQVVGPLVSLVLCVYVLLFIRLCLLVSLTYCHPFLKALPDDTCGHCNTVVNLVFLDMFV